MKYIVWSTLSVTAFLLINSANANPAKDYDHPPCAEEKINAHLTLYSTLDRYTVGEYYSVCGLPFDEDKIYPPAPEECMDSKIDAFRETEGEETPIRYDVLEEWRVECLEELENSIDNSVAIERENKRQEEYNRQQAIRDEDTQQRAIQGESDRQRANQEENNRQITAAFQRSIEQSRLKAQRQAAIDANAPTVWERLQAIASLSPDIEVGWESNGLNTWLEVTAIEDRVVLRNVVVNRGNCNSGQVDPTIRYEFGDKARVSLGCNYGVLREVEVTTNRGTFQFSL